jgi:hypothetical protein
MNTLILAASIVAFILAFGCFLSSMWFDSYMRDVAARERQAKREGDALLEKANAELANRDRVGETKWGGL